MKTHQKTSKLALMIGAGLALGAAPALAQNQTSATQQQPASADVATTVELTAADRDMMGGRDYDNLVGEDVVNANGDDVADIEDIVRSPDGELYAVIATNAFLGIGDEEIAIRLSDLQIGEDEVVWDTQMSEDELEQAAGGYNEADYTSIRANPTVESRANPTTGVGTAAGTGAVATSNMAATNNTVQISDADRELMGGQSYDDLIGQDVVTANGEDVADIEDISRGADGELYAIIATNAFLGINDTQIPVRLSELQINEDEVVWDTQMTEDELEQLSTDYDATTFRSIGDMNAADSAGNTGIVGTRAGAGSTGVAGTGTMTLSDADREAMGGLTYDQLVGEDVLNANGEDVGDIEDISRGPDGEVYVIMATNAFLGIGDTQIPIKMSELQVGQDEVVWDTQMSEDELEQSANDYDAADFPTINQAGNTAQRGLNQAGDAIERGVEQTGETLGRAGSAVVGTAETAGESISRGAEQTGDAIERGTDRMAADGTTASGTDQQQVAAADLNGRDVINLRGEEIGSVEDVVRNKADGDVYLVISTGGFLGIGSKDIAVPQSDIEVREDHVVLMTQSSEDGIKNMPEYDSTQYEAMN